MSYAYILQGEVQYIEDRDVDVSKLVAPDLTDRFITIQPGTNVDEGITVIPGMLYSDGKFIENPLKPTDVLIKYQNLLLRRDAEYKPVMKMLVATHTNLSDAQALSLAIEMFPIWPDGVNDEGKYRQGQIVIHDGMRYRIVQDVMPQEHQKPGSEGMLAIYRPIDLEHAGTTEDPIPWVYGIDVEAEKYYSYEGKVYKAIQAQAPSVWYPGAEGTDAIWQLVV